MILAIIINRFCALHKKNNLVKTSPGKYHSSHNRIRLAHLCCNSDSFCGDKLFMNLTPQAVSDTLCRFIHINKKRHCQY
jgi:hypothetical protein